MSIRWELKFIHPSAYKTVAELLDTGWEPFAVDSRENIYFKRKVESE